MTLARLFLALLIVVAPASASSIVEMISGDPLLFPSLSSPTIYFSPSHTISIQWMQLTPAAVFNAAPSGSGMWEGSAASATLWGDWSYGNSTPQSYAATLTGSIELLVHDRLSLDQTGTFPTEILSLNLSGYAPFGVMGMMMLRESPTRLSLGSVTVSGGGGGGGGGGYQADSFFDVFTELSLDGGQTWVPSQRSTQLTDVPEPATLVLVGFGLVGLSRQRRRRSSV